MKLQLATDALRVRLTAAEFARLRAGGVVHARFPLPGGAPFDIRIGVGKAFEVSDGAGLQLCLPAADLAALEARLPCRDGLAYAADTADGPVRILVEVDIRDSRRAPR